MKSYAANNNRAWVITAWFSLLFLFLLNTANAQFSQRRHAVEAGGGLTGDGHSFYGSYVRYFRDGSNKMAPGYLPCPGHKDLVRFFPNRMYGKAAVFYESGSVNSIDYSSLGVDLDFYYTLIKIGNGVFINAKGGAILSSDKIKNNPENNVNDTNNINYGLLAGGEVEWFIVPRLTLVLGADHRFLFNSKDPLDNMRWFAYGGLRFNFMRKTEKVF